MTGAEEEVIIVDGYVDEQLPGGQFRVLIERPALKAALSASTTTSDVSLDKLFKDKTSIATVAHVSGRIRKHRVRILRGDSVTMEMSIYSLTRGRIIKRF